jgi:hypothetical protein
VPHALPQLEVIPSPPRAHASQRRATAGQALQKSRKLAFPGSQAPALILALEGQARSRSYVTNTGACIPQAQGWSEPPSQTHP